MDLSDQDLLKITVFQRNEITEACIYRKLASIEKDTANRTVLGRIADDEERHYHQWKELTGKDIPPDRWSVLKYYWASRVLGVTFGIRLMEKGEAGAQQLYEAVSSKVPNAGRIVDEETEHENLLLNMLDEERLKYVGSVVLGLNDALVELNGALAGLTFALQNSSLIALTGSITGIAAALSMAASEYLSTKAEKNEQSPLKAAAYTGTAYVITVVALIMPYLVLESFWIALSCTLATAVVIIAGFNYYISVARNLSFKRRFAEMCGLSMGVAALSFGLGFVLRRVWGIEF